MEKAIAELDGTIVFNYLDDDIQIIETGVAELPAETEPTSDTSFDENQNPKEKSEDADVEKTIKSEKDLVILLENEVLTPIKVEPSKETSSQPQHLTNVAKEIVKRKRGRSSEFTKPPKSKKVKTRDSDKNLKARKLKDTIKTKKLETPELKKGKLTKLGSILEPQKKTIPKIKIKLKKPKLIKKGTKVNKKAIPKIIIKLKHLKSKISQKGIKARKQYTVIKTKGLNNPKPTRGRPKKQVTSHLVPKSQIDKSINENGVKCKQNAGVSDKKTIVKGKKGRSKSLEGNNSDASKAVGLCISKKLVSKGMECKKSNIAVEMTELQPDNINGTHSEVIGRTVSEESKGLGSSKPKRDRLTKNIDVLVAANDVKCPNAKTLNSEGVKAKQTNGPLDITELKCLTIAETALKAKEQPATVQLKKDRSKSLETRKTDISIISNDGIKTQTEELENRCMEFKQLDVKVGETKIPTEQQTIESKASEQTKPKRGRPRSLASKVINVPLLSEELKAPKAGKVENGTVKPEELDVMMDLTQLLHSEIVEPSLQQKTTTVDSNIWETSKPKNRKSKSLGSKKNDIPVELKPSEAVELKCVYLESKTLVDLTKSKVQDTVAATVAFQDFVPSRRKRGRPKALGPKKENDSVVVSIPVDLPKAQKLKTTDVQLKQLDTLIDLTESQLSNIEETKIYTAAVKARDVGIAKSKGGRPKGSGTKKADGSVLAKTNKLKNADVELKQLDSLSNENELQSSKIKRTSLKAQQQSVTIKSRVLRPSKAKIDIPKALEMKKLLPISSEAEESANTNCNVQSTSLQTKPQNGSVSLLHSKPKRGRPKGFKVKKHISIVNKDIEPSNFKKADVDLVTKQLSSSLVVGDVSNEIDSSKALTLQALGLEARQEVPSYIVPSKGRLLRNKILKQKKVTFCLPRKNLQTTITKKATNNSQTAKAGKNKYSEPSKLVAAGRNVNIGAPKSNRSRSRDFLLKKINPLALMVRLEPLKLEEIVITDGEMNTSVIAKHLEPFQSNTVENKCLESKKGRKDPAKGLKRSKTKEIHKSSTDNIVVTETPKKISSSQPKGLKKTVEIDLSAKKHGDIVEIVDLHPSNSQAVRPEGFGGKKVTKVVINMESQPSTSNGFVETVDLELVSPRNNAEGNTTLDPSQDKEVNGKRKRIDISSSGGNKDFIFPKPKRIKRGSTLVTTDDSKPTKSEATEAQTVEQRQNESVGSKDVASTKSEVEEKNEVPKKDASVETKDEPLKEVAVPSVPRKSMCTVGTQTIEIPDDDVKALDTKISVETQVSPKPKEDKGNDLTIDVENLLPKVDKTSGSDEKDEKVDETVKTKEENLSSNVVQPTVVINITDENQEHGVKYETVEQIHTEFKYESQSEHEDMLRRRRGKLGGPIRGRRRRPKVEATTIDSFVRIIDLNGKIQLKCYNQIFKCDNCLYVGNSKANLDRHRLVHRNPDEIIWFQCTECPYRSKYEHQLKSHFLIHLKPEQIHFFQCPHCDAKCSRKHNLNNHIRSIHSSREYTFRCAECDYTTFSKERLVAHLRKHSKEVHACTKCKFVTKRLEYLKSHFKMKHVLDAVPRPFPCDTCSYKGKTKRELDKHYDRMHNKDQLHVYQCNHCSFNSIYKKNLEFHLLHMHNNSEGFQKFICGHCQKNFSYKNGLKVHIIRCHLQLPDEEWHKCHECKYKSKDVSTLKRHIKRNHGAPRLHCKQCSFATNRQVSMEAHVKTHEYDNEDILKCPECPYRIIQMSSFLYHMKVIHGKPLTSKEAEQYYMEDEC